jgi:hypothetical protein
MPFNNEMEEFDGFLFLPADDVAEDEDGIEFRFIKYKNDLGAPIEFNDIGEKYHVALFKQDENGDFQFLETFEAIFSDPLTYVRNLVGCNLFGTMVKKKERSVEWFEEYLTDIKSSVTMMNT